MARLHYNVYLGEEEVDISTTLFVDFDTIDWIRYYFDEYKDIDGEHHQLWLKDKIIRIKLGAEKVIKDVP